MPNVKTSGSSSFFFILVIGIAMLAFGWVGYVGSDDHSYVQGALGWLHQFPYVGDDHWALRHTVVLPVALSFVVFGMRESSLGLPSALLFLLLLGSTHHYVRRFFGTRLALFSSIYMATLPLFVVQATFPQDVIVQLLAVSLSFWLFYSATRRDRPAPMMFAAGVAAAFGWMTVETTAGLLLFYGLLFVAGFGVPRKYYWVMALGFALVLGLETAYFAAMTGDPLYRYRIDLFHDAVDRAGDAAAAVQSGMTLNLEGNLTVNPILEPFVALLLNQEFGLLFWVYLPAAFWAWRTKTVPPEHRRLLRLLVGAGLTWMAFVSVNASVLYVVPRYFAPFTWSAAIVVVYWLKQFLFERRPRVALILATGLIATNLLCVYVENKNPLFAERALVDYLARHEGVIYTDPVTLRRAKLLLSFRGISIDRVLSEPPPAGSVFYANLKNVEQCKKEGRKCKWPWKDYVPRDGWNELARFDSNKKLAGVLLGWLKADTILPREIFDRLERPNRGASVYLSSSSGASG